MGEGLSPEAVAVIGLLVVAAMWAVVRRVPSVEDDRPERREYADAEITAYDDSLAKYGVAALLLMSLGSIHLLLTSLPPIYGWLYSAGRAGDLARAAAGEQLMLAGSALAGMGIVWHLLPRASARPLRARWLASLSFWFLLVGALGFYLGRVGLNLWMAFMFHAEGLGYEAARGALGHWIILPPVAAPATAMSLGYGFFAVGVWLTARGRSADGPGSIARVAPIFVAAGLMQLVGVILADIFLAPDVESQLLASGWTGAAILSHAPAYLVLLGGVGPVLGGLLLYLRAQGPASTSSKMAWAGGLPAAAARPLLMTGIVVSVIGFAATLILAAVHAATGVPTAAGDIGIVPATGMALAMVGAMLGRGDLFFRAFLPSATSRAVLTWGASGSLALLVAALAPGAGILTAVAAAAGTGMATYAFGSATSLVWSTTGAYRHRGWQSFTRALRGYDGPPPPRHSRMPVPLLLGVEAVGAAAGFPGFGWLLSGRGLIGLSLAMAGPTVALAVVPSLASPFGATPMSDHLLPVVLGYLLTQAAASVFALALTLRREGRRAVARSRYGAER